mmetsp:Transcript_27008/g.47046  ORF Transcript_27008/g.47046 Transcript_27008/m.47046 type:complete len:104 (+) Transcript_27008:1126-1437(+)
MVYLPGMEVYASAGGGSADDQLEGPFTVVVPTTTTAGTTCQKEEVLSLFWPSLFRMSSVWNGYLNFVHMSQDFLTDGRLNVSSSDISCSCFSMMGPDPVFIQW